MPETADENDTPKRQSRTSKAKEFVEFLGAHPFATGLLAILGIFGFFMSIAGFGFDRSEAESSAEAQRQQSAQLGEVGDDVTAVRQAVESPCSGPPCWPLRKFASWDTIGTPKDLVDLRIPPPERKRNGQYIYDFDGCRVTVEYMDDAVSYFSARLFKMVEVEGSNGTEYRSQPCDVDLNNILIRSDTRFPRNDSITLDHVLDALDPRPDQPGMFAPDLKIASACLDCGNYREPYLEFMQHGPHANDFVNVHFWTGFYPPRTAQESEQMDRMFAGFREQMRAYIGPEAQYHIDTQPLCGRNIAPDIRRYLGRAQLEEIGLGRGARSWTNVLFCKWWE